MRARKLCAICINYFYPQSRWLFETFIGVQFYVIFGLRKRNQKQLKLFINILALAEMEVVSSHNSAHGM